MRLTSEITVAADRKAVWDVLADLPSHPEVLAGVTRWEAIGPPDLGTGARYDVRMQVGAAQLGSVIEITEFIDTCELAWTSLSGIDHRGRFTIRGGDRPGTCRVRFRLAIAVPGGLIGLVAGRTAQPVLQANVDATVRAVRRRAEGHAETVISSGRNRGGIGALASRILDAAKTADVLREAGLLALPGVRGTVGGLDAVRRYGMSFGTAVALGAARHPDRDVLIDDVGSMTYGQLEALTNAVAGSWANCGIGPGSRVGILCRNGRGFVTSMVAAAKLGADTLLLNTSFSTTQAHEVLEREGADALVADPEFDEIAGRGWKLLESTAALGAGPPPPPGRIGRQVILTSGTTGTPKGAQRASAGSVGALVSLLSRVPLRAGEVTVIASPMFHAWGFAHTSIALVLGSTMVVRSRFDPAQTLDDVARHQATALVAVPVMLQRLLEVPADNRPDTTSLRVVASSGSALPGRLSEDFMDAFGDVLYNLYGSTEVAWATIAGPAAMRLVPGTAGRPPKGTVVKIVDADGIEVSPGTTGRIFVGNGMEFEGYTGGGDKERLGQLVSTGDLGRWDWSNQLMVEGREDDMIVSGGENVFPGEVEDVLAKHPDISDVAVIGVDDAKFGQALMAFVVSSTVTSADEVKRYVKRELASFKAPRRVAFVDALPRNATGKVLKNELRTQAADQMVSTSRQKSRRS